MHEIQMSQPAKNALGGTMIAWLNARLDAADDAPLLLTGTGDAFSAGLNLEEVSALDVAGMQRFLAELDLLVARLFHWPAPFVAAVNGHAIAGGCVLVQCADYRIAASDPAIKIGLNEVALGVYFPPRIFKLLRARLTPAQLERAVLGAGLHAPADALALGLVDELAADPLAAARAHLARLASHPRSAYTLTKETLRGGATDLAPEDERRMVERALPMWTSDAVRKRMLAVLEGGRKKG